MLHPLRDSLTPIQSGQGIRLQLRVRELPVRLALATLILVLVTAAGFAQANTGPRSLFQASPDTTTQDSTVLDTTMTPVDTLEAADDAPPPDTASPSRLDSLRNAERGEPFNETPPADTTSITELVQEAAKPIPPIEPPDSTAPTPLSPVVLRFTSREWHRHGFASAGEVMAIYPGLFPRHADLHGHPFYLIPPGGNGRDLAVIYRKRPWNDPTTGATNWVTTVPEEFQITEYNAASTGQMASSGPVLRWIPPYRYDDTPVTRVVYRQEWYGLGRADWRIAHQLTPEFAYHIGVNIAEFQGRYNNTFSNTNNIRVGARQTFQGLGHLFVQWMQAHSDWGKAFDFTTAEMLRNDVDLILYTDPDSNTGAWQEAGLWYTRSQNANGYANDDGNRIGFRAEAGRRLLPGHEFTGRLDVERSAARFPRRRNAIDPQARRWVAGVGVTDQIDLDRLQLHGSLRSEYAAYSLDPDTTDVSPYLLAGGSLTGDYDVWHGVRLHGILSSSWRHASLDEIGGFWSVRTPDRWMDVFVVPDFTTFYQGNASLKPVKTDYAAGGFSYHWADGKQLYLMSGVRNWRDRIIVERLGDELWSRENLPTAQTVETTAYGWAPVWGPLSVAGSFTYAEPLALGAPVPETSGFASLRYMDFFYNGQLRIRATANMRYWGSYSAGNFSMPSGLFLDGLVNVKIFDFEAYYGTTNVLSDRYDFVPYYPNTHRVEIWGVRWVLFK